LDATIAEEHLPCRENVISSILKKKNGAPNSMPKDEMMAPHCLFGLKSRLLFLLHAGWKKFDKGVARHFPFYLTVTVIFSGKRMELLG
jgi:hypothetical protein